MCLFSCLAKTRTLHRNNEANSNTLAEVDLQYPAYSSPFFFLFSFFPRRPYLGIKCKAALLHPLNLGKTKGRALKAKVTAEEQLPYSLVKQPPWADSSAFSSQFPPDQKAVSTICIIHEAERANSMLWLGELLSV